MEIPLENKKGFIQKKFGLVFYDAAELIKLDDKALHILLYSQVVVTSNDIAPKELFTKMVQLVKKDDEKEEKERQLNGLLQAVVLFVRKSDFERIQEPLLLPIKPFFKQAPNDLEGFIREVEAWTGIDRDTILYYLADVNQESFSVLAMSLIKKLKETAEDKQKYLDRSKKLEVDKKTKELDLFKTRSAE